MKKLLFTFLMSSVLVGCGSQKMDESLQTKQNKDEIILLEKEISSLKDQISHMKAEVEEAKEIRVSQGDASGVSEEDLADLKDELLDLINKLDQKVDKRLTKLEGNYQGFIARLDSVENNYVKLEDFQLAINKIENDYAEKKDLMAVQYTNVRSLQQIESLRKEFETLNARQDKFTAEYQAYFVKSIVAWNQQLTRKMEEADYKLTRDLKKFISEEVQRITLTTNQLNTRLEKLEKEKDENQSQPSNPITDLNKAYLDKQIAEVKKLISQNNSLYRDLNSRLRATNQPKLADKLIKDLYAPCELGLKRSKECHAFGTIIQRLGGKFIDPTNFKRTRKDLIRYFVLSGVETQTVLARPELFTKPDPGKMTENFKACHSRDSFTENIPPQKDWARGVILSLTLQEVEKDLNQQKRLKFVGANITPAKYVVAWWRSQCYLNKMRNKTNQKSDHLHAAGFDLSFENKESFNYLRDYIEDNIWNNDTFDIVFPLHSSNLILGIGMGLGHGKHGNGKMHFGLLTPNKITKTGQRRQWTYKSKNHGDYQEILRNK